MPVVMCSLALWKRIGRGRKLPPLAELELTDRTLDDGCRLGNWSAKTVTLFRRPHVLFANQQTLLCALVPMAPSKTLFERFGTAVAQELERFGIDESTIQLEVRPLSQPRFARNADKSLLGSLNDLTFQVKVIALHCPLAAAGGPDYRHIHAELNSIPHVNRPIAFADHAVSELFGRPRPERGRFTSTTLH